jgi:tetratricopeptide (TPR) repeat protein
VPPAPLTGTAAGNLPTVTIGDVCRSCGRGDDLSPIKRAEIRIPRTILGSIRGDLMRAFLSHSSADKAVVVAVQSELEPDSTWLDRAEIEWGDLFLEKIADGIRLASDFVLFWSRAASKSEWVRIEINMAFIQALRKKAIRLRVIALDDTALPLYLAPYHVLSVVGTASPSAEILQKLRPLLREPVGSVRSRFVNRHDEIAKIEAAVDDPDFRAVWAFGFTGAGKISVIQEALKRIFEGAEVVHVDVTQGTGFVELALNLAAEVRHEVLPESLDQNQLEQEIRLCIETLAKNGQLLVLSNAQHWFDEEGMAQGPLLTVLSIISELAPLTSHPVFLTSTRRPSLDPLVLKRLALFHVAGLKDGYVSALVRNWYYAIYGNELAPEDANRIAPKLFGHPIAARLVAGLLGNQSVDFLERYPSELIALRRDLARTLLQDLRLSPAAEELMETLALAGIDLPASVLAATSSSEEEFQQAVAQCASAGLIVAEGTIETHPLFRDFYWHRLHRGDYRKRSIVLAEALQARLLSISKASPEYASLVQVAFRAYALAGEIGMATALRRDLSGELEATAVTLYNRRDYPLADQYVSLVLDGDAKSWRMRLYRARIRIRQEQWEEADQILSTMLEERPLDVGVLHAKGWSQLKQRHWPQALRIFTGIIARREHLASLRDAAECLHRLHRNQEALEFLAKAKGIESENPFALDLESRILEDMGQLDAAFNSAELAASRDPLNERMQNRLGMILIKQRKPHLAIDYFISAMQLDPNLFSPANSLAAAYLEIDEWEQAEKLLPDLENKARTPSDRALLTHTRARIAFAKQDLNASKQMLKSEIAASRNVIPNLGLLVRVQCELFDQSRRDFPAIASVELQEAENALTKIVELDPSNEFTDGLRRAVTDRQMSRRVSSPR